MPSRSPTHAPAHLRARTHDAATVRPPHRMGQAALERVDVLGVPVVRAPAEPVLGVIDGSFEAPGHTTVFFVNAHTFNVAADEPSLRAALRRASLVLNDGIGVSIAGRLRGTPFPENLNGSDLTPRILTLAARRGSSVFLLGGRPGVADQAGRRLPDQIPGLEIAGCREGYFDDSESAAIAAQIRASGAALLVVALGNPRQELWLERHLAHTGAPVGIAVGAFLDFASGRVTRAPAWMNRFGLEWLFRMAMEPKRMWRRYVVGNPRFLLRAALDASASRLQSRLRATAFGN